jgi:hypothetical protein
MTIIGRKRKTVSAREYYCYKLQTRPDEFNILFYGGRFFQQWLMDMYVKVESMRLDWYSLSKHQQNYLGRTIPQYYGHVKGW